MNQVHFRISIHVAQVSDDRQLQVVLNYVRQYKIELLAIDPLYFAGMDPSQSSNIDGRGAFLRKLVEAMQQVHCQLLLCAAHEEANTFITRPVRT